MFNPKSHRFYNDIREACFITNIYNDCYQGKNEGYRRIKIQYFGHRNPLILQIIKKLCKKHQVRLRYVKETTQSFHYHLIYIYTYVKMFQ